MTRYVSPNDLPLFITAPVLLHATCVAEYTALLKSRAKQPLSLLCPTLHPSVYQSVFPSIHWLGHRRYFLSRNSEAWNIQSSCVKHCFALFFFFSFCCIFCRIFWRTRTGRCTYLLCKRVCPSVRPSVHPSVCPLRLLIYPLIEVFRSTLCRVSGLVWH